MCSGGVAFRPPTLTNGGRGRSETGGGGARSQRGVSFPAGEVGCRAPRPTRGVPGAWSTGQAPPPESGTELHSFVA